MRIVFVGGNKVSKVVVKYFVESGHEVVIIEKERERIQDLSELIDCDFIHGDGTKPDILKEVDPKRTDVLICGTNDDHANIIASLLAKTLGFQKVITMISDVDLEPICANLSLEHVIFSVRTMSDYIQELVHGRDVFELSSAIRNQLKLFSFHAKKKMLTKDLSLPDKSQVAWILRDGDFFFNKEDFELREGDEVVIATTRDHIEELEKKFSENPS